MSRLARHALITHLVSAMQDAESWCGRTHIQKTLYTFQTLFHPGGELEVPFILYKHGPYSFALDEDLAEMQFYGGLERKEQLYGARYKPGQGARALRERFGAGVERWLPHVQFVAQRVARKNVRELEALCTLIFVATDPEECRLYPREEDRIVRVLHLKPHLSDTEVRQAHQEYGQLASDSRALTAR
jgi:uncharacterized protein YwgA